MEGGGYQFLVMTCACERRGSTLSMITESDSLFIPPIRISGGIETYHVVSFDKGASARLLEAFGTKGKAKILSRRHLDIGSLDRSSLFPFVDPLSTLTPIQLDALVTSMSLGYYRLPRRTSTGKIAARLKVPRTTFQERRKKAESKLMSALAPYVLTYAGENSLR